MREIKSEAVAEPGTSDFGLKNLYIVGGVAAFLAGVLFRRNIAVEIGLFSKQAAPAAVNDWFELLQSNRLLGLAYLHIFDVVNYALLGFMFLALYAALRRGNKGSMAISAVLAFIGITVYFSTNTAFSMLSLSDQYAAATTEAQRSLLEASGQALLAVSRFTGFGAHPGSGGFISLLFIAIAGMITSVVMARNDFFKRPTAYVGILASALDLAFCICYPFVTAASRESLAVLFIPAAGFLLMVWHIMVGWKLCRLGRLEAGSKSDNQ